MFYSSNTGKFKAICKHALELEIKLKSIKQCIRVFYLYMDCSLDRTNILTVHVGIKILSSKNRLSPWHLCIGLPYKTIMIVQHHPIVVPSGLVCECFFIYVNYENIRIE